MYATHLPTKTIVSHLVHPHASPLLSFEEETGARHRTYVPHVGAWYNANPPTQEGATEMDSVVWSLPQLLCGSDCDANDDDDYFQTFLRSPRRYLDTATVKGGYCDIGVGGAHIQH